jgi:hypothetical protein
MVVGSGESMSNGGSTASVSAGSRSPPRTVGTRRSAPGALLFLHEVLASADQSLSRVSARTGSSSSPRSWAARCAARSGSFATLAVNASTVFPSGAPRQASPSGDATVAWTARLERFGHLETPWCVSGTRVAKTYGPLLRTILRRYGNHPQSRQVVQAQSR